MDSTNTPILSGSWSAYNNLVAAPSRICNLAVTAGIISLIAAQLYVGATNLLVSTDISSNLVVAF